MARRGVLAVVFCGAWILGGLSAARAQAVSAGQEQAACGADLVKSLAGAWKAPLYKMKRAGEIGVQVFGPNAFDVRDVDLTLEPAGQGVLKISSSVLDQKGKTWAPTLIEVKVAVSAPKASTPGLCEPVVTVTSAEEQYLDETSYRAPVREARVMIRTAPAAKQLEVRFETPKGAGSFWSTLTRRVPPAR